MKLLSRIRERLKESPRTKSIMQYLTFVLISAVFWGFLTFNGDVQLDLEVPVEVSLPANVHLLTKVPDTLTVTLRDKGYRFISYMFYNDGTNTFKIDQSHLKKALAAVLNKHATIVSVLPESLNIKFTDLPGKKVPIRADLSIEPRENYTHIGALALSQDSVMVFSDAKTLSEINEVYTYRVEEKDLTDTLRRNVTIAPINNAVVEPRSVDIVVPIEKLKPQTRNVKISVRNAPKGVKMLLFPSEVEVSFRAPVSRLKDDNDITVVVDYSTIDFSHPSNMVEVAIGEAPATYQDFKIVPKNVEYIIEKH